LADRDRNVIGVVDMNSCQQFGLPALPFDLAQSPRNGSSDDGHDRHGPDMGAFCFNT
jgi:hypothetical protein